MNDTARRLMMGAAGAGEKIYVEDVFSTYLYTGNGSTQTITNGIDLSGKGGLVWFKQRNGTQSNVWQDTARGNTKYLMSNATDAEYSVGSNYISSFNSDGFSLGAGSLSTNGNTYGTWTFRKAAKFFDVVTWTGDGNQSRQIPHDLGCIPGAIFCKQLNGNSNWRGFHIGSGITSSNLGLSLNLTSAFNFVGIDNSSRFSSTMFKPFELYDTSYNRSNEPGETYVAYLFAHDAGGFGASGNDSIIKCGVYTGNGSTSGPIAYLGWEPQWILIKQTTNGGEPWYIYDTMRGISESTSARLLANSSAAETVVSTSPRDLRVLPDGFQITTDTVSGLNYFNTPHIYIAIRRGPMKTPTDATKVFKANTYTGNGSLLSITGTGFPPDFSFTTRRDTASWVTTDKLRGAQRSLYAQATDAEVDNGIYEVRSYDQDGITYGQNSIVNGSSSPLVNHLFRRAPGFFDVVAYTGTGASQSLTHNLSAAPELIIVKARSTTSQWRVGAVFASTTYATGDLNNNTSWTTGVSYGSNWFSAQPTSTTFGVTSLISASSTTYIAYLFASCPGVSKVGNYTGTGTTQQINCGFTSGARFVLIKRTDSTGDWYVWDTARGIIAGNDPYMLLNSTAAEVTNTDYIDPYSAGFEISSTAPAAINANGGSFIYLAIA